MKMNLFDYDYYLFDCDGVILDSNMVKTNVFYDVALNFADEAAAEHLRQYHMNNGGISRFEKFEYFFKEYLQEHDYTEKLNQSLEAFKKLSLHGCCDCDYVPGVLDFLEKLEPNSKKFVVSGGAESDLLEIFDYRKIDKFFNGIFGSPKTKYEIVELIQPKGRVLFLGDSRLDFDVAKHYGMDFLFVSGVSEWKDYEEELSDFTYFELKDFDNL